MSIQPEAGYLYYDVGESAWCVYLHTSDGRWFVRYQQGGSHAMVSPDQLVSAKSQICDECHHRFTFKDHDLLCPKRPELAEPAGGPLGRLGRSGLMKVIPPDEA